MKPITERVGVVVFGLLIIVVGLCSPKACMELLVEKVKEIQ